MRHLREQVVGRDQTIEHGVAAAAEGAFPVEADLVVLAVGKEHAATVDGARDGSQHLVAQPLEVLPGGHGGILWPHQHLRPAQAAEAGVAPVDDVGVALQTQGFPLQPTLTPARPDREQQSDNGDRRGGQINLKRQLPQLHGASPPSLLDVCGSNKTLRGYGAEFRTR